MKTPGPLRCPSSLALLCLLGSLPAFGCDSNSALHQAAEAGDEAHVRRILKNGAGPNVRNERGNTPLHLAAMHDRGAAVVRLLIQSGADVNAKNGQGWTPLHRVVSAEMAELLLDAGAEIDARDDTGLTPLHIIAGTERGRVTVMEVVGLQGDAQRIAKQRIQSAYTARHEELVTFLVAKGADLDARDDSGRTPLHLAASWGHADDVELLVNLGAPLDVKDHIGDTPVDVATRRGMQEVVAFLKSKGASQTASQGRPEQAEHRASLDAAVRRLGSDDPAERLNAARTLGERAVEGVTPELEGALPALVKALGDPELNVRQEVAFTLARMGPEAAPAVSALTETLKDDVPPVRSMAALALGAIGPPAKQAVPSLAQAVDAGFLPLRKTAVVALGEIGPDAKAAVPALAGALKDNNAYVRWRAAQAIGRIGFSEDEAVAALEKGMQDEDKFVQVWCASALQKLEPSADKGLDTLLRLLKAEDPKVREAAVQGIGAAGPAAAEAAPALIEAFKTVGRAGSMDFLADALRDIGPAGIDALIQALKHGDAETRRRAIWVLDLIGPPAKKAIPALKEAAQDPRLHYMAEKALKEIQGKQDD